MVRSVDEMPHAGIIGIDGKQLLPTGAVLEDEVWTPSTTALVSRRHSGCEPNVISPRLGNSYGERLPARGGINTGYPRQAWVNTGALVGSRITVPAPLPSNRITIRVGSGLLGRSVIHAVVKDRVSGIGHMVLRAAKIDYYVVVVSLGCNHQVHGRVLLGSTAIAGHRHGIGSRRRAACDGHGDCRVTGARRRNRARVEAHRRPRRRS